MLSARNERHELMTHASVAALVMSLAFGCRRAPGAEPRVGGEPSAAPPPSRSLSVQDDSVVIEGHWQPIEPGADLSAVPDSVRIVCVRTERTCTEDLTRTGGEASHEVMRYRVDEWTKAGTPAGRLIASRRDGAREIQIRVSLSGHAAEKAVIAKSAETRWRLE
jgi:hypothetical protein